MFEGIWSLISAFIVFFIGMLLIAKLSKNFNVRNSRGLLIYIWHTVFCFAYIVYAQNYGADALMYYDRAVEGVFSYRFGTGAVVTFTSVLVQGLGLGFIGCFLFYNILGAIGLVAFDGALKHATTNKTAFSKKIATLIIFLPSVSFWSSAIGKDAISFLSAGLTLWAALQLNKRIWLMVLAVALMMIVRPHMAGIMVIALAMSVICGRTIIISATANTINQIRLLSCKAAHNVNPADKKEIASLPIADDQKLTEGKKIINVAIFFEKAVLFVVACFNAPSKATKPIAPKIL
jgi:hypothetical protein